MITISIHREKARPPQTEKAWKAAADSSSILISFRDRPNVRPAILGDFGNSVPNLISGPIFRGPDNDLQGRDLDRVFWDERVWVSSISCKKTNQNDAFLTILMDNFWWCLKNEKIEKCLKNHEFAERSVTERSAKSHKLRISAFQWFLGRHQNSPTKWTNKPRFDPFFGMI